VKLGGHDHFFAPCVYGSTYNLFGLSIGVDICGVDQIDTCIQGAMDDIRAFPLIAVTPRAEHRRAEGIDADTNTSIAQQEKFHSSALENRGLVCWAGVRWKQAYPHHLAKNLGECDRGLASDTIYEVALRAEYSLISGSSNLLTRT
jgi:hypothetical protein